MAGRARLLTKHLRRVKTTTSTRPKRPGTATSRKPRALLPDQNVRLALAPETLPSLRYVRLAAASVAAVLTRSNSGETKRIVFAFDTPDAPVPQACELCSQSGDESARWQQAVQAAYSGAETYAWCPACCREVDRSRWDAAYKRRWQAYLADWARDSHDALVSGGTEVVVGVWRRGNGTAEVRVAIRVLNDGLLDVVATSTIEEASELAAGLVGHLQRSGFRFRSEANPPRKS